MQTNFADIENLSEEELERIKTKYNLVSGRGHPQNILDEDIRIFQARTPGKTCMVGTPGRHYTLGEIPSSIYNSTYDTSKKRHESEWINYDPSDGLAKYRSPMVPKELHALMYNNFGNSGKFVQRHIPFYDGLIAGAITETAMQTHDIFEIPEIRYIPHDNIQNEHLLPEEFKLQLNDSRYTSMYMYHTDIMLAPIPEDEIDQDHEQFNLNFNTYRYSRNRCKIELKIGNVYTLELGKKEKRLKDMTLAKMDDITKSLIPMLYFTENHNWWCGTWKDSALMNVSILKIKESSKEQHTYAK